MKVTIVVREAGKLKPDYSVDFELPAVPGVGSYISIHRPDNLTFSEDLVVRKVWWQLRHPETAGFASEPAKIGTAQDIVVECDIALGPYASDRWRKSVDHARNRGAKVEEFEVARFSVRESDLKKN